MCEKNVKVSVVIPIYNVEDYVENALRSLQAQTFSDFEIILIDDGSTDRSMEVAAEVLKNNSIPYSSVYVENAGVGEARNIGLRKAVGDWVLFLDSDDALLPETLERMVSAAQREKAQLVFSNFRKITDYTDMRNEYTEPEYRFTGEELQQEFLYRRKVVLVPGTLYSRQFLLDNGLYFEELPWSEDQHFMWRVLSRAEAAYYIPQQFYRYYRRPGSIMHSTPVNKMLESYTYIKQLPADFEENSQIAKYIVPRWVMGTVNAACDMVDYAQWKYLQQSMDAPKAFKVLVGCNDRKTKLCAMLGRISPRIYYWMMRKYMKGRK